MITENWAGIMAGIGKQINTMLSGVGVNASQCPQPARDLHINDFSFQIPSMPSILSFFAAVINDKYYFWQFHVDKLKKKNRYIGLCNFIGNELVCNGITIQFLKQQKALKRSCILYLSLKILEIILMFGLESVLVSKKKNPQNLKIIIK